MSKRVDEAVFGKRTGHSQKEPVNDPTTAVSSDGLLLSQIQYEPIEFFKPNPCNTVFEPLKTEQYYSSLKDDIDKARTICNPLIAMQDGLLIEGHSRLTVAKLLESEGKGIGRIPVRIVLSALSDEQIKQRVYLGNLSRFEIDEDTRISLYAEIWPDYYGTIGSAGRKSDHGDTIRVDEIAKTIGKSIPQVKRDAAIYRNAKEKKQGSPNLSDIKESRKEMNKKRKKPSNISSQVALNGSTNERGSVGKGIPGGSNSINEFDWSIDCDSDYFYRFVDESNRLGHFIYAKVITYLILRVKKAEDQLGLNNQKKSIEP